MTNGPGKSDRMIVVRFADDIVLGFQEKADADQIRAELTERMRKFNLELHPEKTRLLKFGPYAIDRREWRGEGKPETFNFLGFTHICVKNRSNGRFTVLRQTIPTRLQAKLNEVNAERTLSRFRVGWYWHRLLSRRSQNGRVLWDRMRRLITRWLPWPSVCHPYPLRRLGVVT